MDAIELKAELAIPYDAPEKARNRKTYASFGEDGLTATANAHGHLIQITRYFGNEPSGFICVDLPGTPEPYLVVNRMMQLQRSCEDSFRGMKLQLPERGDNKDQTSDDLKWGAKIRLPKMQFYQDRWPCFITQHPWLKTEVQYFISGKTVYQIYTFSPVKGRQYIFPEKFPPPMISAKVLLRHLDFVAEEDPRSPWNCHPFGHSNDHYIHGAMPDTKTIFIKHKGCETRQGKEDAILFISPYIDNRSQSVGRIEHSVNYEIQIDNQAKKDLQENKRVKITLAYTLELASSAEVVSSPLSKLDLGQLKGLAYRPPMFVDDKHLNFMLRRNLEHILSVCSIPIKVNDQIRDKIIPIALTCGDISGHRIARKASFYAFQFLLKAFEYFDNSGLKNPGGQRLVDHPLGLEHATCKNYSCRMRFRIWKTCRGHLKWISDHMETEYTISKIAPDGIPKEIKEQGVGTHYWASGQVIDKGNKYLRNEYPCAFPDREITDAPMQIIKFGEFYRITGDEHIPQNIPAGFQSIAKHWARSLREQNRSGAYAALRIREEDRRKFYLADHAFIWWASKSLENLRIRSKLDIQLDHSSESSKQRRIGYSSDEIKSNIIKRFTMENPTLKTRMIAISRSFAETKFSLSMRETVLFYAMDLGLFNVEPNQSSTHRNKHTESSNYYDTSNKTKRISNEANESLTDIWENVLDEWTNTVNYQARRKDQHDAYWDHPLQFALSTIMSAKNKRTNSRLAAQMFEYSRLILLESSSANGLFPGQLDVYKGPALFDKDIMCDNYWHNTFEVPFILWKYSVPPSQVVESPIRKPESTSSDIRALESLIQLQPGMNSSWILNNGIDQGKVVALSDEWLYNELNCFGKTVDLSPNNIERLSQSYQWNKHMTVISRAAKTIIDTTHRPPQERILGYIIDIPQKSDKRRGALGPAMIYSSQSLIQTISLKRTPKNAPKRLLHFCRATDRIALICFMSAHEHPGVSTFFDRHKAYSKHFHEEINAVLNLWVTELHLSFYRIIYKKSPNTDYITEFDHYDFPQSTYEEAGNPKHISRATMSFRFDGDFFDHHWTCHFFEFDPNWVKTNHISDITRENIIGSFKADPWKQRRVLELVLFGRILQEMVQSSQNLLDEIKGRILEGFEKTGSRRRKFSSTFLDSIDIFNETTSNTIKTAKKSLSIFQYLLQVVEEDLCENLTKIDLWIKREERPEHDRPQWTLSNEHNYRGAIYMLQKSNELLIQDLRLCCTKAKSLNTSLTKGLESALDKWEIESNEDIRLFTYVTVVFLPISFATGVFSMSSAPTSETLNSMIATAGLALLVTVIALLYAKVLYGNIVQPFFAILQLVIRILIYTVGLIVNVALLILTSFLAILPREWIYSLRGHAISLTKKSPTWIHYVAHWIEMCLNDKIREKLKDIDKKLVEEENFRRIFG